MTVINTFCLLSIVLFSCGPIVNALECYVCLEQEDNNGKCISTVETCNYDQDRCLSHIKWGSTPYWEIGAPMQYFISKQCATVEDCLDMRNQTLDLCQRIEWRDWSCSECCQGDRCNYYITLGSSSIVPSVAVLLIGSLFSILGYNF